MRLSYMEAAALLASLTPEEQAGMMARQGEILSSGGTLVDVVRIPLEEIADQRAKAGNA